MLKLVADNYNIVENITTFVNFITVTHKYDDHIKLSCFINYNMSCLIFDGCFFPNKLLTETTARKAILSLVVGSDNFHDQDLSYDKYILYVSKKKKLHHCIQFYQNYVT